MPIDIIPLSGRPLGYAALSQTNSEEQAGPATLREFTLGMTGGNGGELMAAPGWTLPMGEEMALSGPASATAFIGGFGNSRWLRNPTDTQLRLRLAGRIDAPRYCCRLTVANPSYIEPVRYAYSVWTMEQGRDMGNETPGRVHVASFHQASLAASTRATLVGATHVPFPFAIEEMLFIFGAGVEDGMRLSVYAEGNDTAPTAGPPGGRLLTGGFGTSQYIVGTNTIVSLRPSDGAGALIVPERDQWLKVHAHNTDTHSAHAVNAIITVRLLPGFTH